MNEEVLKDKLRLLNDDELLFNALRITFSQGIELEKPNVNREDSNELLGEKYRAYTVAKEILNKIMLNIQTYKIDRDNSKNFNKGR